MEKRSLCGNAERHCFIQRICQCALDSNVNPFGGVARDLWIRQEAADRFYKHLAYVNFWNTYSDYATAYNSLETHTSSLDRLRQPNDVDLLVGLTKDIDSHHILTTFLPQLVLQFKDVGKFEEWRENTEYVKDVTGIPIAVFSSRIFHRYGSFHTGYRHLSVKVDVVFVLKDNIETLLSNVPIHVSRLMLSGYSRNQFNGLQFEYTGLTADIESQMLSKRVKVDKDVTINADLVMGQAWMQRVVVKIAQMQTAGWTFERLPHINNHYTIDADGFIKNCSWPFQLFKFKTMVVAPRAKRFVPESWKDDDDIADDEEVVMINMKALGLR